MSCNDKFSRLAVIPARGGSTRLKNKNIYPLGGKPLICHTIEAVVESDCFYTIIVSTDSEAIADEARKYSEVEIYDRPAEYAGERVTVLEALVAMMNTPKDITGPINLGNPGEFTMLELAEMVIELTNSKSKMVFADLPQDDPTQRKPDISKAKEILKWKPEVQLREGLSKTIEYFASVI